MLGSRGSNQKDVKSSTRASLSSIKGQLTGRGIVVGCIGCAIITASSIYTALKMGALPWPIVFAAIISFFALKAISKNKSTLNEANVTHTIMSSGAMIAGGLAFTIPGAWMLGLADEISLSDMLWIALCGSAIGLVASIALRRHFVEDENLEYPIGEAAAQTLIAASGKRDIEDEASSNGAIGSKMSVDSEGADVSADGTSVDQASKKASKELFGSMGFAAIYCFLRDGLHAIPSMLCQLNIPGVVFGIYNSPMMLAVGFLVGTGAVLIWFAGGVIANLGIIFAGSQMGIVSVENAQQIVSCLGMGCMIGCGVAVIVRDIIPKGARSIASGVGKSWRNSKLLGLRADSMCMGSGSKKYRNTTDAVTDSRILKRAGIGAFIVVCAAAAACIALGLPPAVSAFIVVGAFVACAMSAQSVGQTGIDPMEIFGIIVVLLVMVCFQTSGAKLFVICGLVACACGLAGDVMNDFHAGYVLKTSPKAQWIGQGIGAVVGSVVAVIAMQALFTAYGADAFGVGKEFVSAQASVVASMVSGIQNVPAFIVGVVVGFVLYLVRFPSMMLGLGIYLPFYMSLTAFLGALVRIAYDAIQKRRALKTNVEDKACISCDADDQMRAGDSNSGLIVASGLLGGESIVGVVLALVLSASAFM